MNDADRLFARIAISKNYVTPAHVEEARSYLEKLGPLPVPLSLAVVLQKLGRITRGHIAAVQKEMEPFVVACPKCGAKSYRFEVDDAAAPAPLCERCRGVGPEKTSPITPDSDRLAPPPIPPPPPLRLRDSSDSRDGEPRAGRDARDAFERRGREARDSRDGEHPRAKEPPPPTPPPLRLRDPREVATPEPTPRSPLRGLPPASAPASRSDAPTLEVEPSALAHAKDDTLATGRGRRGAAAERERESGDREKEKPPAPPASAAPAHAQAVRRSEAATIAGSGMATLDQPMDTAARTFGASRGERVLEAAPPRDPENDPLIGKVVGGAKLEKLIGKGGMGTVYRARQLDLDRPVAVKILSPQLTTDGRQVQQFFREAKALAKLEHPNIVTVYSVGKEEDLHYIQMQLIEGGSVEQLIRRESPLPIDRACDIVIQAAKGLLEAHAKGIVHRDVKPENMLLAGDTVKVTDFGLARMEGDAGFSFATGRIIGTPFYMSPEQIDGREVDARTDIYALGVTLYYLLTGMRPYMGETPVDILLKHVNEPLIPPRERRREIPEELSRLVAKMLVKDVAGRYQSLKEVLRDLDLVRRGQSIPVDLPPEVEAAQAPIREDLAAAAAAPLVPEPVRAERPRSFGYLSAGLAAAAVLAAALGAVPIREILADRAGDEGPRPSAVERAAEAEVARVVQTAQQSGKGLRAGIGALKALAESRPGSRAAEIATKRAAELEAEAAKQANAAAARTLAEVAQHRQNGRPGMAIEALIRFPQEHEGTDAWARVRAELEAVKLQLATGRRQAYIPQGPFFAGDGKAVHEVAGFYIDLYETTNAEWHAFVKVGGPRPSTWAGDAPAREAENLPVTGISFEDARAYARWKGDGRRLPTALEWEKAARGTDGRRFPWGDQANVQAANCLEAEVGRPEPVGSRPAGASPFGCFDMAGNVAEWVIDSSQGHEAPAVKGGGFLDHIVSTRAAYILDGLAAREGHPGVGFRLVQPLER